jgi:hypothetical protein
VPVFKIGLDPVPGWCELKFVEIVELPAGATHIFERRLAKEKLIVGKGQCRIAFDGTTVVATRGPIWICRRRIRGLKSSKPRLLLR